MIPLLFRSPELLAPSPRKKTVSNPPRQIQHRQRTRRWRPRWETLGESCPRTTRPRPRSILAHPTRPSAPELVVQTVHTHTHTHTHTREREEHSLFETTTIISIVRDSNSSAMEATRGTPLDSGKTKILTPSTFLFLARGHSGHPRGRVELHH